MSNMARAVPKRVDRQFSADLLRFSSKSNEKRAFAEDAKRLVFQRFGGRIAFLVCAAKGGAGRLKPAARQPPKGGTQNAVLKAAGPLHNQRCQLSIINCPLCCDSSITLTTANSC
jgi:hypothetical protein